MFITSGELTPLSWGLIGASVVFIVQLLLCFRAKRKVAKFLPLYLILLGILFSGLTYLGVFGAYSAGVLSGNELVALILVFICVIAVLGMLFAWLVYWIASLAKKNRRQ